MKKIIFMFSLICILSSISYAQNQKLNDDLIKAVEDGNRREVLSLLKQGASPNAKFQRDGVETSALMYAIIEGHRDIALALIKARANVNDKMKG